ncbi:hypothetical protein NQ318_006617 [Aromia moschata]|uniref:Uncharacterized protein n=1 Tax=Aromia moschata TaxID=1265417 RepID=A0AAV8XGY8_9CUCU|nr:hypothetical protein NQ318_006617 [Aromia moschata]
MAGASDRHLYHNDTSSDTEDYTDDRRRRVFKNRMRYHYFVDNGDKNRATLWVNVEAETVPCTTFHVPIGPSVPLRSYA